MTKHSLKKRVTPGQKKLKRSIRLLKKWTSVEPKTSEARIKHRRSLLKKIKSLRNHHVYLRKKHTRENSRVSPASASTPKSRRIRPTPSPSISFESVSPIPRYISPPVAPIYISPISHESDSVMSSPASQVVVPMEEGTPTFNIDNTMSTVSNGPLSLEDLQLEHENSLSANTTHDITHSL
jgi:hypothetical protein